SGWGCDSGGNRRLDDHVAGGRRQPLETNRSLNLSRLELEVRPSLRDHVPVLDDRSTAAPVRQQAKVEVLEYGALNERTGPAQQEGVGQPTGRIVKERSAIGLDVTAEMQREFPVRRAKPESVLVCAQLGPVLGGRGQAVLLQLALTLEYPDLLIQLLQPLLDRGRILLCLGAGGILLRPRRPDISSSPGES